MKLSHFHKQIPGMALLLCSLSVVLQGCATAETPELRNRMKQLREQLAPLSRDLQKLRAQLGKARTRAAQRKLQQAMWPLQSSHRKLLSEMREPYLAYARRASPAKVYGSEHCCDHFLRQLKKDDIEFTFIDTSAPSRPMWELVRRKRGKDANSVGYPVVLTADDKFHAGSGYEQLRKLMGPASEPLTVYGNNQCGRCVYYKQRFEKDGIRYKYHNVDLFTDQLMALQRKVYPERRGWYTMPVIELKDGRVHVGYDYDEFAELLVGVR